jgi:hypothetical protein
MIKCSKKCGGGYIELMSESCAPVVMNDVKSEYVDLEEYLIYWLTSKRKTQI